MCLVDKSDGLTIISKKDFFFSIDIDRSAKRSDQSHSQQGPPASKSTMASVRIPDRVLSESTALRDLYYSSNPSLSRGSLPLAQTWLPSS